jgi:hypothetical protein
MKSAFLIALLSCFACGPSAWSQRNVRDSIVGTPWISANYGLNWTAGDMANRHGLMNHVGMLAGYKTRRNWVYSVDGAFMFGNQIKETNLFSELVDSKGNITDQNGDIAIVRVLSRGYYADVNVGKIFPVLSPNKNSGIFLNLGVGYTSHNYRIETNDHVVPQLELDYRKGYDRLTTGLNTQQFLGYAFMANQGIVNFYGGFYIQEAYTYNRRTIFFDQPDTPVPAEMRLDIQYGFKLAWLVPIYRRLPKEYYYN